MQSLHVYSIQMVDSFVSVEWGATWSLNNLWWTFDKSLWTHRLWCLPMRICLNLCRIHRDATWRDYVPQKFHLTLVKTTLLQFYIETIFLQLLQSLANMYIMLLLSFWVDQNIIQVNYDENIKEISKNVICHMLKNRRCIHETKWHLLLTPGGNTFNYSSCVIGSRYCGAKKNLGSHQCIETILWVVTRYTNFPILVRPIGRYLDRPTYMEQRKYFREIGYKEHDSYTNNTYIPNLKNKHLSCPQEVYSIELYTRRYKYRLSVSTHSLSNLGLMTIYPPPSALLFLCFYSLRMPFLRCSASFVRLSVVLGSLCWFHTL